MATASYNVAQITNFDIQDLETFIKNDIEYVQYTFPAKIEKLGFCSDPRGIGSTMYLYLENNPDTAIPILIGKSGMFEIQPETYSKLNKDNVSENIELKVNIVKIDLPKHLNFVLDYAYLIN